MRTPVPLAFGALLAVVALTACSASAPSDAAGTPKPKPTASETPAPAGTTEPVNQPTPTPSAEPACDTVITEGTVEALTSQGWTAKQEEFRIGETVLDGGLVCLWSDYSTASDHGQMYGWAPLDVASADAAQRTLQSEGWLRSAEGDSVYLTEDPEHAIATDDEGFGMTYEFGDGWVKVSDTKQGLLLIDWM
ncbi:hypothetical protein [Microbacterium sp. NPDC058345]|uniref:hypothetical protein n=1 Tax=Microbacterium sp. NPDC058345 TaxID=3346455 RepID=UPI003654F414